MKAMTAHQPDDTVRLIEALARARGMSADRLVYEMAALMLTDFDAESRFAIRVRRGFGHAVEGLGLLEKATRSS